MKNPLFRSKSAYWVAAFVSAAMAGIIFPANIWFRQGLQPVVMVREFTFGFFFTLAVWWYNLVGYPLLERRLFKKIRPHWPHFGRILTTLLFSYLVIWADERLQILHIDDDLQGYVEREGANEFRAAITASFVLLVIYFLDVLRKFYQTQMENEHLKLQTSVAHFEALKQQVNPHFLFNSLNILKTMVKVHDPKSEEYVLRLSDLYRNLLLSNQKEKVTLEEELTALENYFFMLNARFEDKLLILQSILPTEEQLFVPTLALQMLVENCIKHNVASADKPLKIELFRSGDYLAVRNNLQPKRSVEHSSNIGLNNIRQRYLALTGKEIEIVQTDSDFTVRLPLIH